MFGRDRLPGTVLGQPPWTDGPPADNNDPRQTLKLITPLWEHRYKVSPPQKEREEEERRGGGRLSRVPIQQSAMCSCNKENGKIPQEKDGEQKKNPLLGSARLFDQQRWKKIMCYGRLDTTQCHYYQGHIPLFPCSAERRRRVADIIRCQCVYFISAAAFFKFSHDIRGNMSLKNECKRHKRKSDDQTNDQKTKKIIGTMFWWIFPKYCAKTCNRHVDPVCKYHSFPHPCVCSTCVYQALVPEGGNKLFIINIIIYWCFSLIFGGFVSCSSPPRRWYQPLAFMLIKVTMKSWMWCLHNHNLHLSTAIHACTLMRNLKTNRETNKNIHNIHCCLLLLVQLDIRTSHSRTGKKILLILKHRTSVSITSFGINHCRYFHK